MNLLWIFPICFGGTLVLGMLPLLYLYIREREKDRFAAEMIERLTK